MNLFSAIAPIFLLIFGLIFLDSFKLIKVRTSLILFGLGILSGLLSFLVGSMISEFESQKIYSLYTAPVLEEFFKSLVIIILIRRVYTGFIIDTLIYGCIIGSGFAFAENLYYYFNLSDNSNLMIHLIRGFGTALMHGANVGITGALFMYLNEKMKISSNKIKLIFVGLVSIIPAILIHFLYNTFFLPPIINTVLLILIFVVSVNFIFSQNEKEIHKWISDELDSEIELLNLFQKGEFSNTHIGRYINQIKVRFDSFIVFDMIMIIKLTTELSMQLKINMMLRNNDLNVPIDNELESKLSELKSLMKSVGKTGISALKPILNQDNKSLWKLNSIQ